MISCEAKASPSPSSPSAKPYLAKDAGRTVGRITRRIRVVPTQDGVRVGPEEALDARLREEGQVGPGRGVGYFRRGGAGGGGGFGGGCGCEG